MWLIGAVPMNNNGANNRYLVERNNGSWDEQKEVRDVIVGEVQGLGSSQENEFRINDVAGEVNNGLEGAIQVPAGLHKPQPQGPVIHWERFLSIKSLNVLLVENDDSTRFVVSALLRNCSYEVTAVANGLQAWNILKDLTNHIDLVLTEVVVPFLSGFDLLCKMMSHKTFKNIPVIMMSSHDSMNVAFNCLSKGAVDFLVKPIRKNELKNLWQHVWRRCHSLSGNGSGSGSGSESGTQTKKYAKSRSNDESENNTGSSDGADNGSIGLSIRDGSDNGSGTQSSWTKRAAEVDSPRPTLQWDQLSDAPDSTCAQVIHTKPETFSSRWVHFTEAKECTEQDGQLDNVAMGKDLEIGIFGDPDSQLEYQHKFSQPSSKIQEKLSELDSKQLKKEQLEIRSDNICGKQRDNAANLISAVGSCIYQQVEKRAIDAPSGFSDTSQIKVKASSDSRELTSLELALDRLRGVDVGSSVHDNHNILKHSKLSAFSKYGTTLSANQASPGKVGSCSPRDNSSVTMKREKMHNSNSTPPNQQSNESSNNNDMASTTKYVPKLDTSDDKSESISAFKCLCPSGFQNLQFGHACAPKSVPGKAVDVSISTAQVQARGSDQRVQVQHCHHHHHHHHHIHNIPPQPQPDHDDLLLKNMAAAAAQCGSSNMLGGPIEVAAGNYSVNGSASGSNHGSNGQNGTSNAVNAGATNIEIDNGVSGDSGVVGISGSTGNGADEDRHAQRAAALTKFRQKRKERCFEKKVRYQSRKRLAEQRPRVRGQFVRQIVSDDKVGKDKKDNIAPEDNSPDDV